MCMGIMTFDYMSCCGGASSEKSERSGGGGDFDVFFQSKGIPN